MSDVVTNLVVKDQASVALKAAAAEAKAFDQAEKELAKSLDITTAQLRKAQAAVADQDKVLRLMASDAAAASRQMSTIGAEAEASGTKALKSLGPLAGVLSRVSPEAGAVASSLAGMTSAAEGFAAAGIGVSVGGLAAAAAVALPVVLALGAAYLYLKQELDAVDEANAKAAATAAAWQTAAQAQSAIVRKISDDYAVATGASSTYDVELKNQVAALDAARQGERALFAARVEAAGALHTPELVAAKQALADYDAKTQELTDHLEVSVRTKEANAQADRNAAAAAKGAAAATKAHADAERALRDAMSADQAEITQGVKDWYDNQKMAADFINTQNEGEMKALMDQVEAQQALNDKVDEWTAARIRAGEAARESRMNTLASDLSGPSAVMSGVASAGPIGAIIAALVNFAKNFGSIGDMFNDFTKSFQDSIMKLPETLGEHLGEWLQTAVESLDILPNFIQSLVTALPDILETVFSQIGPLIAGVIKMAFIDLPNMLVELVEMLSDGDMWYAVGEAILQGFEDGFLGMTDESGNTTAGSVVSGIASIFTGGLSKNIQKEFATGTTYVPKTGMYMVHEGERISANSGAQTGTMQRQQGSTSGGGGGGDTHYHISGFVGSYDELARAFRRQSGRGLNFGMS